MTIAVQICDTGPELRYQQKSGYETSHKGKIPTSEKEQNTTG